MHIREVWIGSSRIAEVTASGSLDGKPFRDTHLLLLSLRTTPDAYVQLVRVRCSVAGWHRIRDTKLN